MTRVTIVGGGYGGIVLAKALDDVAEVVLVEQKDTFVNHAAALRAVVDRRWAERIFMPYDRLLARGRVVHGTALAVRGTTVSVTGAGDIGADHLVLATGTAYPFPAKHLESSAALARARIERAHAGLERAGRVLVVAAEAPWARNHVSASRRRPLVVVTRKGERTPGSTGGSQARVSPVMTSTPRRSSWSAMDRRSSGR